MRLFSKIALTLSLTVAAVSLAAIVTVSLVFLPQYRRMDQEATTSAARRVLTVLNRELAVQKSRTSDWANWDDTFRYATDFNTDYEASNLSSDALHTINAAEFMIAAQDGRVLRYVAADAAGTLESRPLYGVKRLPPSIWPRRGAFPAREVFVGLAETATGPVIVSYTRITDSKYEHHSSRLLVLTRALSPSFHKDIEVQSGARFRLVPVRGAKSAVDQTSALSVRLSGTKQSYIASIPLASPAGRAAYTLVLEMPAAFTATARETIVYVAWILVMLGLLTGIVLVVIMRKVVTEPLELIIDHVRSTSRTGSLEKRLNFHRTDELGTLANAYDEMLSQLQDKTSELVATTRAAQEAEDAAVKANKAKSVFISNISHELRTPLNAIIGFSEMISRELHGPVGDNRYTEHAGEIAAAGGNLLKAINALIDTARLDTGGINLTLEELDLKACLSDTVEQLSAQANANGVTWTISDKARAHVALGDPRRTRQILYSILDNAVKHAPGGTAVSIDLTDDDDTINVAINDQGPGIAASSLQALGQPFLLEGDVYNRSQGGLGLGLSLSSRLLKLQNGQMLIDSSPSGGTCVRLRFRKAGARQAVA